MEAPPEATADVDLVPDETALARLQLQSGLPLLAEATLRRLIARFEAHDARSTDELDAARALLAEVLWRQQRPIEAGATLASVRAASDLRRQPVALIIEADAAAAGGNPGRALEIMERVVEAAGPEAVWQLRAGVPSSVEWPDPFADERPAASSAARPAGIATTVDADAARTAGTERTAAAHARLEAARAAFTAGDTTHGAQELSLALRLDLTIAPEGIVLLESSVRDAPDRGSLLLYGDLLAAAGRADEAAAAYDRAAADGGSATG